MFRGTALRWWYHKRQGTRTLPLLGNHRFSSAQTLARDSEDVGQNHRSAVPKGEKASLELRAPSSARNPTGCRS